MRALLVITMTSILLAACGGSSNQDSQTASCLHNALAAQFLGSNVNNCNDSSAADVFNKSAEKMGVTCTHQAGDQYVCDVKLSGATSLFGADVPSGFYNVSYDGKSITYQPS